MRNDPILSKDCNARIVLEDEMLEGVTSKNKQGAMKADKLVGEYDTASSTTEGVATS